MPSIQYAAYAPDGTERRSNPQRHYSQREQTTGEGRDYRSQRIKRVWRRLAI